MQREVVVDGTLRLRVDGLAVEGPLHVRVGHAGGDARQIDVRVPFGLYRGVEIADGRGHS